MIRRSLLLVLAAVAVLSAPGDVLAQTPGPSAPPAPPPAPGFPPFQLPPFQWPPGPWTPAAPSGQPAPAPAASPAAPSGGLLTPLFGAISWQGEVRSVLGELIANLSPDKQALVKGIPLIFDPNSNTINAFAGCDEKGAPFIAGTEGLLEAIDAIAQTVANDDLYGTHTYEQYTTTIMPRLVQSSASGPALPLGIIPLSTVLDPRRLSHARELFDEIVAFTFGHELSHHYLGHTGCAVGQGNALPAMLGTVLRTVTQLPVTRGFNQPAELAADYAGIDNVLDSGRARRPGYTWGERGGLLLLDFFLRMDRAAGVSPVNPIGFLQSHPHPALRIPWVQFEAQRWHQSHPG